MSLKVQVSESLAEETQQFAWTIIFQELYMSKISFDDHQGEYSLISNASYELINIVKPLGHVSPIYYDILASGNQGG